MHIGVKKPRSATRTLLVVWVVVVLAASVSAKNKSAESKAEPGDYAGVDACKTLYQEVYEKNFERTPHFKTTLRDGHGCESCRGRGAAHVAGGGDITKIVSFKKLSRQESNTRCLSCHSSTTIINPWPMSLSTSGTISRRRWAGITTSTERNRSRDQPIRVIFTRTTQCSVCDGHSSFVKSHSGASITDVP